jgi:hypothetical protein
MGYFKFCVKRLGKTKKNKLKGDTNIILGGQKYNFGRKFKVIFKKFGGTNPTRGSAPDSIYLKFKVKNQNAGNHKQTLQFPNVEKIEHRLVSWKMMYLSKGGRVTLIKRTLSICLHISCLFFLSLLVLQTT